MKCPVCGVRGCKNGSDHDEVQVYKCTNKDCARKTYSKKSIIVDNITGEEMIVANVRLAKTKQRLQDTQRIERKSFREHARIENAVVAYNKELISLLTENKLKFSPTDKIIKPTGKLGIFHLTDTHFNELIEITGNTFDFSVASKRLQKFTHSAIEYFKFSQVEHVLIAFGGDFLNSDRRLDELLSNATNRSRATLMSVELLRHMIEDIVRYFNVTVAGVCGNESRAKDELGWTDIVATDNYDHTMFEILRYLYVDRKDIRFAHTVGTERVIEGLIGFNILLMHGMTVKQNTEKSVQSIRGKYAGKGILIDFILLGHLHSCRIGDHYARGASLAGANAYSDQGLQLQSRASQNIHIVHADKSITSIKIDVQNTDGYEGYDFTRLGDAYNPKSARKLTRGETVFRVII